MKLNSPIAVFLDRLDSPCFFTFYIQDLFLFFRFDPAWFGFFVEGWNLNGLNLLGLLSRIFWE